MHLSFLFIIGLVVFYTLMLCYRFTCFERSRSVGCARKGRSLGGDRPHGDGLCVKPSPRRAGKYRSVPRQGVDLERIARLKAEKEVEGWFLSF